MHLILPAVPVGPIWLESTDLLFCCACPHVSHFLVFISLHLLAQLVAAPLLCSQPELNVLLMYWY